MSSPRPRNQGKGKRNDNFNKNTTAYQDSAKAHSESTGAEATKVEFLFKGNGTPNLALFGNFGVTSEPKAESPKPTKAEPASQRPNPANHNPGVYIPPVEQPAAPTQPLNNAQQAPTQSPKGKNHNTPKKQNQQSTPSSNSPRYSKTSPTGSRKHLQNTYVPSNNQVPSTPPHQNQNNFNNSNVYQPHPQAPSIAVIPPVAKATNPPATTPAGTPATSSTSPQPQNPQSPQHYQKTQNTQNPPATPTASSTPATAPTTETSNQNTPPPQPQKPTKYPKSSKSPLKITKPSHEQQNIPNGMQQAPPYMNPMTMPTMPMQAMPVQPIPNLQSLQNMNMQNLPMQNMGMQNMQMPMPMWQPYMVPMMPPLSTPAMMEEFAKFLKSKEKTFSEIGIQCDLGASNSENAKKVEAQITPGPSTIPLDSHSTFNPANLLTFNPKPVSSPSNQNQSQNQNQNSNTNNQSNAAQKKGTPSCKVTTVEVCHLQAVKMQLMTTKPPSDKTTFKTRIRA